MRFGIHTVALGALFQFARGQQYAGDTIPNSLPTVPGTEITYFKIKDSNGANNNLTLINYYSHGSDDKRIVESNIRRAVIAVHGLNRDPGNYMVYARNALSEVDNPDIDYDSVAIIVPYFPNGDDKNTGYPWTDGLAPGEGSTSNALVFAGSQWSGGSDNHYPHNSRHTSSYDCLDQIIQYFDDQTLFPNMAQIVVAGHSLGAQAVQRYAAIGKQLNTRTPVSYWVGNPNSFVWMSTDRPLSTASCADYDDYREGYTNFTEYPMTYQAALVASGRDAILERFNSRAINYARGTRDFGDDSDGCAPATTGVNRAERFLNFLAAFPPSCSDASGINCDTVDYVYEGHDANGMMVSPAGQARLYIDNFYGNGSRAYDFGYPRNQTTDDPNPDPSKA